MPHRQLHNGGLTIFIIGLIVVIVGALALSYVLHKDSLWQSDPSPTSNNPDTNLSTPDKKEIAMQLIAAAENSSLDWRSQYSYIEYNVEGNDAENRGYTAGLVGFTSATGDMLTLLQYYQRISPGNILERYLPALERVNGSADAAGLDASFVRDWKAAADSSDGRFRAAQDYERDRAYFTPAIHLAQSDGLHELGQFAYYDAAVMHGIEGLNDIRATTLQKVIPPSKGGEEAVYLNHFLDIRRAAMLKEVGHSNTSRVDTMQRKFLQEHNLRLTLPLTFSVYGDSYTIR